MNKKNNLPYEDTDNTVDKTEFETAQHNCMLILSAISLIITLTALLIMTH